METYDSSYLKRLIAFNTVSGTDDPQSAVGTNAMAQFLSDFLLKQGLIVLEIPCASGQKSILGLAPSLLEFKDGSGLGLLLSGHYDVVPFASKDWRTAPLTLTQESKRYLGRGTADMKGFLSCMLQLAAYNAKKQLKEPLPKVSYLFTCEEETSMAGAQSVAALLHEGKVPEGLTLRYPDGETVTDATELVPFLSTLKAHGMFDLTVIGEPTELQPILGHKGWIARDLILQGQDGHGSRSPMLYSAVNSLSVVLSALQNLKDELKQYADNRFELAPATLSIGTINGGQSYNTICSQLTLGFEVRPTPKLSLPQLNEMLDDMVKTINNQLPPNYPVSLHCPYPDTAAFPEEQEIGSAQSNDEERYLRYLEVLSPSLQKKYHAAQASSYVAYCTEASWLQVITKECIIMGPGSIADAHQANEGIAISELEECWWSLLRLQQNFSLH